MLDVLIHSVLLTHSLRVGQNSKCSFSLPQSDVRCTDEDSEYSLQVIYFYSFPHSCLSLSFE
jgi:hypothetical protein